MKMKYRFLIAALCVASFANAMTLNEAKKLFLKGEYEKVLPTFKVYAQNIRAMPITTNGMASAFMKRAK